MRAQLVSDYARYKERSFLEQLLRSSNAMFIVFTYWNLIRAWVSASSSGALATIVVALAALSGVSLGALVVLRFGVRVHLAMLPFLVLACAATLEAASASRLFIVPGLAFVSLVLVRAIIGAANRLNRL